jgi:hypothetical protein
MINTGCTSSHIAFLDESNWNSGDYRSVSMVSMSYASYTELIDTFSRISSRKHREMKWRNIDIATGKLVLDFVFDNLANIRIDVLTWHMQDSRHKDVRRRDDEQNLQRMFYRLIRTVLHNRWTGADSWKLYMDQQDCISCNAIKHFLEYNSWTIGDGFLSTAPKSLSFMQKYSIRDIKPVKSHDHPFVQLADFFAGIVPYSYLNYYKIMQAQEQSDCLSLIGVEEVDLPVSNSDLERIPLVWEIYNRSKKRKQGVSFPNSNGLNTPGPGSNLNFWLYKPQHEQDKAPTKGIKTKE